VATAPQAIQALYTRVSEGSKVLSGIVGDIAHSFGYHLARNELPFNDYSVVLPLDREGDASSASALDIKLSPPDMVLVTNRLLAGAKAGDPRLAALREFCGTTDGVNTHPYDLSDGQDGPLNSWDSTHLWHIHLSFYRAYANDAAALAPIADVINGVPPTKDWFDMATQAQLQAVIRDEIAAALPAIVKAVFTHRLLDQDGKTNSVGTFTQCARDTRQMTAAIRSKVGA
jgi:hypothetical protein